MSINLPTDQNGRAVQTLCPKDGQTTHGSPTESTQVRVALGDTVDVLRIATSGACWVAFGDVTITASSSGDDSLYFPAGVEIFYVIKNYTHVALKSVAGEGTVAVTVTLMI